MPVAVAIPWIVGGLGAAATVVSTIQQKKAAQAGAAVETATADYNARVDRADATQVELDSRANIRALREDAATYMSRQRAGYAAAGVRVDSGSPLAVRAATAGAFALREQQAHADANAKMQRLESAARSGIAEGAARADAFHQQGVAAVVSGAAKLISQGYGAYNSGMFSGSNAPKLSSSLAPGYGIDPVPNGINTPTSMIS